MYSLSPYLIFPQITSADIHPHPGVAGGRVLGHVYIWISLSRNVFYSCLALCWVLWHLSLVSLLHDWNVVLKNKAGKCGDEIPEVALHQSLVGEQQERRHIVHRPDQLLRMKVTILQ
jgi:hypothetical protein